MWILLSLIGAFSQAFGYAFKKKALQTPGMNNVIGFISFTFAGIIFFVLFAAQSGTMWTSGLAPHFWYAMFWYASLNVAAFWFMYKALDIAEFNHLMPFMTITSLALIVPPIFILGEIPSRLSLIGITLVVVGALYINWPQHNGPKIAHSKKSANRKGVLYFLITAACFTIAPTAQKITVTESSVLFASAVVHVLIGLGFGVMILVFRELPRLTHAFRPELRKLLVAILAAGAIIVAENGSINAALVNAPVANVFALKRIMPFFAFLIGLFYFKERTDIGKKIAATALMIVGAVLVTLFVNGM